METRVPSDVVEAIDAEAHRQGITRAKLLRRLLIKTFTKTRLPRLR